MEALKIKEQIKILEMIDWKYMKKSKSGLCFSIRLSIRNTLHIEVSSHHIKDIIPLFTRGYALQFKAKQFTAYWWATNTTGYEYRKQFINWVIEELEKQLQNETTNS